MDCYILNCFPFRSMPKSATKSVLRRNFNGQEEKKRKKLDYKELFRFAKTALKRAKNKKKIRL